MKTYWVTVDVPFMVKVKAASAEDAKEVGDGLIAAAYAVAEDALDHEDAWLGSRYDDTDVSEVEDESLCGECGNDQSHWIHMDPNLCLNGKEPCSSPGDHHAYEVME